MQCSDAVTCAHSLIQSPSPSYTRHPDAPFGQSERATSLLASACVRLLQLRPGARMWRSSGQVGRDWLAARRVGHCLSSADAVSATLPDTPASHGTITRSALGPQTIFLPPLTFCPHSSSRLVSAPNSRTLVLLLLTCTIYQLYLPHPSPRPSRLLAEHHPHRRY
jgi:hypothetical protein